MDNELPIRPLDAKQKLVIEFMQAMRIEEQLTAIIEPTLKLPPFIHDAELSRVFMERYKQAFLAERPAFAMALEATYSEEELRFYVDLYKSPLWQSINAKHQKLGEHMHAMMLRIYEAVVEKP